MNASDNESEEQDEALLFIPLKETTSKEGNVKTNTNRATDSPV